MMSKFTETFSSILAARAMITVFLLVLLFAFPITNNEAAKILAVFPTPSISHQVVFRSLTQELAKRGHEVVVITTDPAFPEKNAPQNFTEIDVHDLSYNEWQRFYEITSKGDDDMIAPMRSAFSTINSVVEKQLKTSEVQKLIKEERFDLLFLEACAKPALVLSYVFNAPVILISSFGFLNFNVHSVGAAWHPLLYPSVTGQKINNLTKWEKIVEIWNFFRLENLMDAVEEEENEMAKRLFGQGTPTMKELQNNVDMIFLNVHPLWANNRPVPPSVVHIWGVHKRPEKELPKELKSYLDASKNGVIYMSLGTNVRPSLLPPEKIKMIINVFSKLPYDVLWKYDKDELPGRTKNIKISKWLPQSDMLKHPKIKVFITQGGLQSTEEAIIAGVPLIGIPMLGDQWYNVEQYLYHKIGARLEMKSLQEEDFFNTINTVINDSSYRQNIARLRKLMRDEQIKPLDRAIWWTEYVLRHGGASHLRAPAANISWTQYLELELVFTILSILFITLSIILIIVFNTWKCIRNSMKQNKIKIS